MPERCLAGKPWWFGDERQNKQWTELYHLPPSTNCCRILSCFSWNDCHQRLRVSKLVRGFVSFRFVSSLNWSVKQHDASTSPEWTSKQARTRLTSLKAVQQQHQQQRWQYQEGPTLTVVVVARLFKIANRNLVHPSPAIWLIATFDFQGNIVRNKCWCSLSERFREISSFVAKLIDFNY